MAERKLIVSIIGDDSSFQAALVKSEASAKAFGRNMSSTLGRSTKVSSGQSFGPLLDDVKRMQGETAKLSDRLQEVGPAAVSMRAGIGPAAALTFGVTAAYQASRQLSASLKTTGSEAFTTTGKLKNFGAALFSGDILGGIKAIAATPKTFEDLGISVNEAEKRLKDFELIARSADGALGELGRSVVSAVASYRAAINSQDALADSVARLGTVFRDATGQAVLFKGAVDDLGGPRGPGAVDQINAALEQERRGRQKAGPLKPLSPSDRNQNAIVIAQANGDLDEVLRLQIIERDKVSKILAQSDGNVKQRQALASSLAQWKASVISTQKAIKAAGDAANAAAKSAAEQRVSDAWAKIIGGLQLNVDRAELTSGLRNDVAALEDLKSGLQKQIRAGVNVAAAQTRLVQVTGLIASKNAQIQENTKAALQAGQFKALGLSATGDEVVPGIENLTKRLKGVLGRIAAGDLDVSSKLVAHLKTAQKLVAKEGDKLTEVTRSKINDFLKAASGKDSNIQQGPLTKGSAFQLNKFLEGLNVSPALLKKLEQRFTRFSPSGLGRIPQPGGTFTTAQQPFVANITVELDGKKVGQSTKRFLQNDARHNPKPRR